MKVMLNMPGATCMGCGCQLYNIDLPDKQTGEFEVECGMPGCENRGTRLRMQATVIDLPVTRVLASWPADAP